MNIQFKKGILELCVLTLLSKRDCYGYDIINSISKNITIAEGTIYPLLRRLKNEGYVTTYLKESNEGPPRKYYTLTEQGEEVRGKLKRQWDVFIKGINEFFEEGDEK